MPRHSELAIDNAVDYYLINWAAGLTQTDALTTQRSGLTDSEKAEFDERVRGLKIPVCRFPAGSLVEEVKTERVFQLKSSVYARNRDFRCTLASYNTKTGRAHHRTVERFAGELRAYDPEN